MLDDLDDFADEQSEMLDECMDESDIKFPSEGVKLMEGVDIVMKACSMGGGGRGMGKGT